MQLSQGTETAESTEHIFMFVVFSQSRNAFTDPVITSYRQVCAPRAIEHKLYFEFSDISWTGVDA